MGNKLLILVFLFTSVSLLAQKKEVIKGQEKFDQAVKMDLDLHTKSEDFQKYISNNNIKGSYTFEMSVQFKGMVEHVRPIERTGDVPGQNRLKDYMMEYKFPFKLVKGTRYKFQYTFENL